MKFSPSFLDVQRRVLPVLPFISGLVAARGLTLGPATDYDSRAILELSIPAILQGSYEASRSFGFPLYEGLAAALYAAGGLVLVNAFSLLMTVVFGLLVANILARIRSPLAGIAAVAILFLPIVLINATIMMETALTLCVTAAIVLTAMDAAEAEGPHRMVLLGFLSTLAILTRPDNVLLVGAVHLALLSMPRSRPAWVFASGLSAVVAAGGVYVLLWGGVQSLLSTTATMVSHASTARKAVRAALLMAHSFSLPGAAALTVLLAFQFKHFRADSLGAAPFIVRLAIASVLLYVPRFLILPDELEYLIVPVVVTLIAMACIPARPATVVLLGLLAVAIVGSNVVQLSLFRRTHGGGDAYAVKPSLEPGALIQDWSAREHRPLLLSKGFSTYVAKEVFGFPAPDIHAPLFWHAFISRDGDLVTDADNIYLFDNTRLTARPELSLKRYRRVFVCDETIFPDEKAWRVLRPSARFTALQHFRAGQRLHCRQVQ